METELILTHPGGSHKDEFLACCLLAAKHGAPIVRREPEQSDLDDPSICVVDVGGEHDPARNNFDHHQFPRDHDPICALSLVLQDMGLYEDARLFCDWLEPAEWFDTRGPNGTAKWLGVDREVIFKLSSPVDITLLRRFAKCARIDTDETLHELMSWVGQDLIDFITLLRVRLKYIEEYSELWELEKEGEPFSVLYMPRTEPLPEEPSGGLERYLESVGLSEKVAGLVYPDRRGEGYSLARHNDHPKFDFTRIDDCDDVHFAHAAGFVAKTSATEPERLKELVAQAWG